MDVDSPRGRPSDTTGGSGSCATNIGRSGLERKRLASKCPTWLNGSSSASNRRGKYVWPVIIRSCHRQLTPPCPSRSLLFIAQYFSGGGPRRSGVVGRFRVSTKMTRSWDRTRTSWLGEREPGSNGYVLRDQVKREIWIGWPTLSSKSRAIWGVITVPIESG